MSVDAHTLVVGRPGYKPARFHSEEPCPFCGAVVVDVSRVIDDVVTELISMDLGGYLTYDDYMIVECIRCHASRTMDVER